MKVDFGVVRNSSRINVHAPKKSKEIQKDFNSVPRKNFSRVITFSGNPTKNLSQVASIAPEYQGLLNDIYKIGGLGNVAGEAAVAFQDSGKMDFRTFVPYYSPNNPTGEIKIKTPGENGFEFKAVPLDYTLKEGEDFVIHNNKQQYKILERTSLKGTCESINDTLDGIVKTPYHVFKVKDTGINLKDNPPVYVIHTPELAKFAKSYGGTGSAYASAYGGAYGGGSFDDALYSIFSKSTIDAIPKMDTEEFGFYNPGNYWLHDRQAFPSLIEISQKSADGDKYWRGIKAHSSYHNPGRDYQGHYRNPIDFLRIAGSKQDLEALKKNEADYQFIKNMIDKIETARKNPKDMRFSPEEILSKEEFEKLDKIFKPIFGNFIDETGEYNLCKIPVEGVRKNPFNFSAGTVSTTYGKEMKNHNTKEIAKGLTRDFASIPTVDIVNGSSAKSLKLDVIGNFGSDNGFTDVVKQGFTPLTKEITSNPESLFEAKQSNKQWLIDTIAQASQKGRNALNELFFSKNAIEKGSFALGELSPFKKGDVLFISWGRPDTQKGFPTTLEGLLQFLKNDSIDSSTKSHAKFLIGAGPWGEESMDWKTIQKQIDEIATLENGKYKGNVCYLNGFFTNRIVACADYTNITSRYEPCGITPLESFAGATPVISNKTGGSPDFIIPFTKGQKVENQTGFLTKNAYFVNPEVIGADKNLTGEALDSARRVALGKENAQCIEEAISLINENPEEYKKMMINAINSKIDWCENSAFNNGKTAIEKYKECAWALSPDNLELTGQKRNLDILSSLKGTFEKSTQNTIEAVKTNRNKQLIAFGTIAGILALGLGRIAYVRKKQAQEKIASENQAKAQIPPTLKNINIDNFAKANKK